MIKWKEIISAYNDNFKQIDEKIIEIYSFLT
jgi:hypothetical protein